jgi:hypothetical protein
MLATAWDSTAQVGCSSPSIRTIRWHRAIRGCVHPIVIVHKLPHGPSSEPLRLVAAAHGRVHLDAVARQPQPHTQAHRTLLLLLRPSRQVSSSLHAREAVIRAIRHHQANTSWSIPENTFDTRDAHTRDMHAHHSRPRARALPPRRAES